jgi:hypothetical protein
MPYCPEMLESEPSNQRKRSSRIAAGTTMGWRDFGMVAMTVGFGAAITGLFGLGEGPVAGRQSGSE